MILTIGEYADDLTIYLNTQTHAHARIGACTLAQKKRMHIYIPMHCMWHVTHVHAKIMMLNT